MRSGREREPFEILWDARQWKQDLQIALIDAAAETPVSVAYMDMNDLKLSTTNTATMRVTAHCGCIFRLSHGYSDDGQAYRLGGDEQ